MSPKDYWKQNGSRRAEEGIIGQSPPRTEQGRPEQGQTNNFSGNRATFQWHNFRPRRPLLGELAVKAGFIAQAPLDRLIRRQHHTGERIGESLVISGDLRARDLARLLSIQSQSTFIDLKHEPIDPTLSNAADLDHYIEHQYLPWRWINREVVYVATDPARVQEMIETCEERPCLIYVATPKAIRCAIQERFYEILNDRARLHLARTSPESSAQHRFSPKQAAVLLALFLLVTGFGFLSPQLMTVSVSLIFALCFLSISALKFMSILVGRHLNDPTFADARPEHGDKTDKDLPVYSVLVPLFREAAVLPILIEALSRLDYPAAKLQILLIFEESDSATIEAAKALKLPDSIEFIRVPHSLPLTKPNIRVAFFTVRNLKLSAKKARPIAREGESLGAHLLHVRRQKGLTQRAAAKAIGVNGAAYNFWEWDKGEPSAAFWPAVIRFLEYDPICANPTTLGERLDAFQRRTGLTRKAIGQSIGVSRKTLLNWETDKTKPRGKAFGKLEALLTSQLAQPYPP